MKKENIFDLYESQHKDEPAQAADRLPGEVKPEDMTPTQEAKPAPETKKETPPEQPKELETPQDPELENKEGGTENGI